MTHDEFDDLNERLDGEESEVVVWSADQIDLVRVHGAENTTDFWFNTPPHIVEKLPSFIIEEIDTFLELYFDEMNQRKVKETRVKISYSETAGYVKLVCTEEPFKFMATVTIYSDETFANVF